MRVAGNTFVRLLSVASLCSLSGDGRRILATAWEPYQELFQGVVTCIHSDFRIGGLRPGETKQIGGKIYLMDGDVAALLKRYERDFPEQTRARE
jgi:hypothetical protein